MEDGMTTGQVALKGRLQARVVRADRVPLSWRLRNVLRLDFLWGWLAYYAGLGFSRLTGIPCMLGKLSATLIRADGRRVDYGVLGYRVVTTAFVNFMVDQLQTETSEWGDFKYHDSGVGTTDPAVGDTDIETTDGESRATGTQTEGASANIYRSVGTISYSSTKAITEHGLFSQATGSTLMDRSEFSAINVVSGDSIQFTYELTVSAGG
jgi:hypothetical protein